MENRIDFTPLDANNAGLPDSETAQIDRTIELLEADVHHIDREIARLQKERDAHLEHINRLRAAKSSVRNLPHEVLSKILFTSIWHASNPGSPDDTNLLTLPYMKGYVPWVARQVSTRWRAVSLANPSLWCQIRLCPPPRNHRWPLDHEKAWDSLLDRCKPFFGDNKLVELSIQLSPVGKPETISFIARNYYITKSLEKSLLHHLEDSLGSLHLSCDLDGFLPLFHQESLPWRLPESLHTLSLDYTGIEQILYTNPTPGDNGILHAPRLHTLCIRGNPDIKFPFDRSFFLSLPWPQLTNIVIDYPQSKRSPMNVLLTALRQCSSLVSATLKVFTYYKPSSQSSDNSDSDSETESSGESESEFEDFRYYHPNLGRSSQFRCTLGRLQSLKLSVHDPEFFHFFTLPTLAYLSISQMRYESGYPKFLKCIEDFIRRSQCQLRAFIENPDPSSVGSDPKGAHRGFLEAISPSIEELQTCIVFDDFTLQQVASGELLPELKSFKFCYSSKTPYNAMDLLERRFGWLGPNAYSYSGLRKVRMVCRFGHTRNPVLTKEERKEMEIYKRDQEAKHSGLELHIGPKTFTSWDDNHF